MTECRHAALRVRVSSCNELLRSARFILALSLALCSTVGCQTAYREILIQVGDNRGTTIGLALADHSNRKSTAARVRLFAALHETVSFEFSIEASESPIDLPRYSLDALSTDGRSIAASAIQIFRMHPVHIDVYPGWHIRNYRPDERNPRPKDVLVPVDAPQGGWPATLVPGQRYDFWVDITLPKAGSPGSYLTRMTFFDGDRAAAMLTIEIEVWPFSLPDRGLVPLIAAVDHRLLFDHHISEPGQSGGFTIDDWRDHAAQGAMNQLLTYTVQRLRQHGLTPVLPRMTPITKIGTRRRPEISWDQYDQVASPILDGSLFADKCPLEVWSFPIPPARHESDSRQSPAWSAMHGEFTEAFLADCARHFDRQGWLSRSFVELPAFHSSGHATSNAAITGSMVRRADARIPILVPWFPQDMKPYGWTQYRQSAFESSVDIWLSPAQFFDAEIMAHQRALGRKTWLTADRPPFSGCAAIQAPEACMRVLAQQAVELGAQAVHLGTINHWPPHVGHVSPQACINFDNRVLLYPGGLFGLDRPVESVRLKHLRRSMQDQAYHVLLERHDLEHVSQAIRSALAPYAGAAAYHTNYADGRAIGWQNDTALFEVARQIMARELMDRVSHGKYVGPSTLFNKDALWRRLMLAGRRFQVEVQGTRIRLGTRRDQHPVESEIVLDLFNNRRAPISGCVTATALPAGWSEVNEDNCFNNIPAGSVKPFRLKMAADSLPAGPDGHAIIPLEIKTGEAETIEVDALVSCVTAHRLNQPLTIDGDLADWPPGSSNVAGDFHLISAGTEGRGLGGRRPTSRTIAFVARDDVSLLVGITCETTRSDRPTVMRRKAVMYEDMIPVGEELIELLIDPHNAGSRSPEDLFHIVVKRSGIDVTEMGIRFDPPCGRSQPWPVDIEIATRVTPDRWSVEMRIPLSAFGLGGMWPTIWGFNITRFDLEAKEFSTWAAAVRNAYDPASLGNLYIP
ncbi:MAG: hypothetical protein IID42_03770 [Planctomycetes bacterium]|nr:hypothetical protein [Planctomycetota bacterium]